MFWSDPNKQHVEVYTTIRNETGHDRSFCFSQKEQLVMNWTSQEKKLKKTMYRS